jgi:hypothetical protein
MVVEFTTTCAIIAYHLYNCKFEPHSWWDALDTALCDKVRQWLATGRWFPPGTQVSSTNKTDLQDIAEILLNAALSTINQPTNYFIHHDKLSIITSVFLSFRQILCPLNVDTTRSLCIFHPILLLLQVLCYYSAKLEQNGSHMSPNEVLEVIKEGSKTFRRDRFKVRMY